MKNTDLFKISVVNTQRIDDTADKICEEGTGSFYIKGDKMYIIYKTEEEGITTSSIITVEKNRVTVKRNGAVSSKMILDRGKKTEFKYNTMYGMIDVVTDTSKIVNALTERGGKLRMVYDLIMQGAKLCNDTTITVDKM